MPLKKPATYTQKLLCIVRNLTLYNLSFPVLYFCFEIQETVQQLDVPGIRRLVSYVLDPAMFFDALVALQTQDLSPRHLYLCTGLKRHILNGASVFDVGGCLVT